MKTLARFHFKRLTARRLLAMLPFALSLAAALLSGMLLFYGSVMNNLVNAVITTGFDQLRAQLIAALILVASSAFTGSLVGRRKLGAMLGAAIIFCLSYLLGFVQLELQPTYDAGGHLEPLDTGALVHTSLVMLA
ncbi:MAG TPA: hypothetical protein VFQ30_01400, partial [Ktedonobacteraceae bacterium]|nr:hypothetical protein [Ktedonobacteraceae bacterium]